MRQYRWRTLPNLLVLADLEKAHPTEPHYYLQFIGTDPAHQGGAMPAFCGMASTSTGCSTPSTARWRCGCGKTRSSSVKRFRPTNEAAARANADQQRADAAEARLAELTARLAELQGDADPH